MYKILLIEDDEFIGRAYKDGLTRAGFDVSWASDGQEGLEQIKALKPDLVLLDLVMPVKNGFEVLEELKAQPNLKVPVIILSNLGQDSDVKKAKVLGAQDYLIKTNVSMKEIIDKVEKYLTKGNEQMQ